MPDRIAYRSADGRFPFRPLIGHRLAGAPPGFPPRRRAGISSDFGSGRIGGVRFAGGAGLGEQPSSCRHDETLRQAADVAAILLVDAMIATGKGDRVAFRDVYMLTSAKLFGICLRICGDRMVAEDVLHDVYLTVWKKAGTWQPARSSPITWLATIARNRAIDWRRAGHRRPTAPLDDAASVVDPAPDPEAVLCAYRESYRLRAYLEELDVRQAVAIKAAFFDGLSYAELADREGVPLSTMKSRVRRGLAQLKLHLVALA